MRGTILTIISAASLIAGAPSGQASQEGKGGNVHKAGFKRLGLYINHEISTDQKDVADLMANPREFGVNLGKVPVRMVKKFPPEIVEKYGEDLVGVTITDPESPTGYTVLLHRVRYPREFARFAAGKESESLRIVSRSVTIIERPYERPTVIDETNSRSIIDEDEGFEIFEGSFLVFVFHEFLLATGEQDENFEISPFFQGSRHAFLDWVKRQPKPKLQKFTVTFPPTLSTMVPGARGKAEALESFLELWQTQGRANEDAFEAKVLGVLEQKDIVLKTRRWTDAEDLNSNCHFFFPSNWGSWAGPGGVYCKRQKGLEISLPPHEKKIKAVAMKDFMIGKSVLYPEIDSGSLSMSAVQTGFSRARDIFVEEYATGMEQAEQLAEATYGDRLLFVAPGKLNIGNSKKPFYRPNCINFSFIDYRSGSSLVREGMPGTKAWVAVTPVAYVIE